MGPNSGAYVCKPTLAQANLNTHSQSAVKLTCWNCGGNHHLKDCTKPVNQSCVDKNCQQYFKAHPKRKTDPNGCPMMRNKNGLFVVDTKRDQEWKALLASEPNATISSSAEPTKPEANIAIHADTVHSAVRNATL